MKPGIPKSGQIAEVLCQEVWILKCFSPPF